ncbi:Uncharacterized protein APZ42_009062, partial [Daphnia magna]
MIGEEYVRSGERIRDARGRFVARGSWGIPEIGCASQGRARTRSRPLRESGTEKRGEIEDWANEPQQEQRPASVRQEYHLTFSEEETERWEDAEEEEGSGEHGEEQPEWDFTDLRRRSSNISSYIRGFRAAQQQVGSRHTMAAQIKFQSPPTFGGKDGKDVVQWMQRYKRIGRYNRWGDEELRDHVELSLSGAAQKWYSCKEAAGQLAAEWEDVAGPLIVPGVKTQLLEQFKPVNQNRFNEAKLRERKQGIEESTIEYFYDILDLCRRVDPNMSEATKLAPLWRGIKPSLLEKLWSLKPNSCDEFLQEIKRYQEMTSRARHEEWAMGVVGKQTPTAESERMDRIEKLLEGLMGAVALRNASGAAAQQGERAESQQYWSDNRSILKWTSDGEPICSRCKTEGHIGRECPTRTNGQGGLRGRTLDGQVVCYGCEGIGHIRHDCPSSQREGGAPQQQRQVRF